MQHDLRVGQLLDVLQLLVIARQPPRDHHLNLNPLHSSALLLTVGGAPPPPRTRVRTLLLVPLMTLLMSVSRTGPRSGVGTRLGRGGFGRTHGPRQPIACLAGLLLNLPHLDLVVNYSLLVYQPQSLHRRGVDNSGRFLEGGQILDDKHFLFPLMVLDLAVIGSERDGVLKLLSQVLVNGLATL